MFEITWKAKILKIPGL